MIPIKPFVKLYQKLNNLSLFTKFTLIYVICVLIPVITANTIMLSRVSYNVMMREEESATYSIGKMSANVKDMIISVIIDANNIAAEEVVSYAATHQFADSLEYYDYFDTHLRSKFSEYYLHNSNINDIIVYTNNNTITQGGNIFYLSDEIKNTDWYKNASQLDYSVSMYTEVDSKYNLVNNDNRYISIIRRMNFIDNSTDEAYIKITFSLKNISTLADVTDSFSEMYLYDANYDALFDLLGNNTSVDGYSNRDIHLKRDDHIKYETSIGDENYLSNWSLIGYYNTERLTQMKSREYRISLVINIVIAIIALILVYIIFYSFK